MRQVWLLGNPGTALDGLKKALSKERFGVDYQLFSARSEKDLTPEHFSNSGVVFLLDAFNPEMPGFEGLKRLRKAGAQGPVFLFGEPAPEEAARPFREDNMTCFLPPLDRYDPHAAAALIHYKLHYDGKLQLTHFLSPMGRAAQEKIENIKDFNQVVAKLSNFMSRFGLDVQRLKRALVSLSSAHVKNTPTGPQVQMPFTVFYAMDSQKLVFGVDFSPLSMGEAAVREEFLNSVPLGRGGASPAKSTRSDFTGTARSTANLVVLWGSSQPSASRLEQGFLLSMLPFPQKGHPVGDIYLFGNLEAFPTPEWTGEVGASAEHLFEPGVAGDKIEEAPVVEEAPAAAASAPAATEQAPLRAAPVSSFDDDAAHVTRYSPENPPVDPHAEVPVVSADHMAMAEELLRMQELVRNAQTERDHAILTAQAMADDLKRLLKERRQPLTESDVKDELKEAQERLKRMEAQVKRSQDQLKQKDEQIDTLQAAVARLKQSAA